MSDKMKKVKHYNSNNAWSRPKQREVNNGPSMTVPDQTMSIREIMDRYARGIPPNVSHIPVYNDDEELPEWKTLDLSERQELIEANRERIAEMRKALADFEKAQVKAAKAAEEAERKAKAEAKQSDAGGK